MPSIASPQGSLANVSIGVPDVGPRLHMTSPDDLNDILVKQQLLTENYEKLARLRDKLDMEKAQREADLKQAKALATVNELKAEQARREAALFQEKLLSDRKTLELQHERARLDNERAQQELDLGTWAAKVSSMGGDGSVYEDKMSKRAQEDYAQLVWRDGFYKRNYSKKFVEGQSGYRPTLSEEANTPATGGSLRDVGPDETPAGSVGGALAETPAPAAGKPVTASSSTLNLEEPDAALLKSYESKVMPIGTTVRSVAESMYAVDHPNEPLTDFSSEEQDRRLEPYMGAAKPVKSTVKFKSKDGRGFEMDIYQTSTGDAIYQMDPPRSVSLPKSSGAAMLMGKQADLRSASKLAHDLLSDLPEYDKSGAFGWLDAAFAKTAANSMSGTAMIPIRAAASSYFDWGVGSPKTLDLRSRIAAAGLQYIKATSGTAVSASEGQRGVPVFPMADDIVQGPDQLRRKLESFLVAVQSQYKANQEALASELKDNPLAPYDDTAPTAETKSAPAQDPAKRASVEGTMGLLRSQAGGR